MPCPGFSLRFPVRRVPPPWPRYSNVYPSCPDAVRRLGGDQCLKTRCGSQMRRKAQVLQHLNDSSKLTKKQRYAYAVTRPRRQFRVATPQAARSLMAYIEQQQCKKRENLLRLPAYYSDVPGNALLFLDKSVPLTNYRTTRRDNTSPFTAKVSLY